jgi:hypothetical protein
MRLIAPSGDANPRPAAWWEPGQAKIVVGIRFEPIGLELLDTSIGSANFPIQLLRGAAVPISDIQRERLPGIDR